MIRFKRKSMCRPIAINRTRRARRLSTRPRSIMFKNATRSRRSFNYKNAGVNF